MRSGLAFISTKKKKREKLQTEEFNGGNKTYCDFSQDSHSIHAEKQNSLHALLSLRFYKSTRQSWDWQLEIVRAVYPIGRNGLGLILPIRKLHRRGSVKF